MRIAVDARPLCIEKASGIPTFLRCLLNAISELDKRNEYILYAHRNFHWTGHPDFQVRKHVGTNLYGTVWMQSVVPFWIQQDKIDVFWGTQHILPLLAKRSVRMVLTVHDLIYLRLPHTMELKNLWINRYMIKPSIHMANTLIADSRCTAQDVVELMKIDPRRIHVNYLGIESDYVIKSKEEAQRQLSSFMKVDHPYLLTVGTMEPRKNLLASLAAFMKIADQFPHDLFVVGPPGWKMQQVLRMNTYPQSIQKRVKLLGYIPRLLMPSLYAGSDVFLFPSFYEGFGLPPLEAMACGTPVVASNTSCLPEILDSAALFADPHRPDELAAHIRHLLSDPDFQNRQIQAGLNRSAQFRWKDTAQRMMDIFNQGARS
ncbi:MAG TPA: glycosyltransferase family 1 protein [Elusimicrobiota bacterium]|nr:glycosyltransferase family 1 protein [Elusimicrobiota bacterium]